MTAVEGVTSRLIPGYHPAQMHGFWGVFWLAVILKIPIVALLTLVW